MSKDLILQHVTQMEYVIARQMSLRLNALLANLGIMDFLTAKVMQIYFFSINHNSNKTSQVVNVMDQDLPHHHVTQVEYVVASQMSLVQNALLVSQGFMDFLTA